MSKTDLPAAVLDKVRTAIGNADRPDEAVAPVLSGTTFLEQEPDLAKEAGLRSREMSGWAMGGQPPAAE